MTKKILFILVTLIGVAFLIYSKNQSTNNDPWRNIKTKHPHLDHSAFFNKVFKGPQEVTSACLKCHQQTGKDFMKTSHWNWTGDTVVSKTSGESIKIGKKNLINNFCIGIKGNWSSCTKCHAGYGWKDEKFDFKNEKNIDCLVCHDGSGTYAKGKMGLPQKKVDLLAVAKSVGVPKRENCGSCHYYGGGGLGVKHGDLDNTLDNPSQYDDVHMGKYKLLCIDCHQTTHHNIPGKAYSVSVKKSNGLSCTNCHAKKPHADSRINSHLQKLACVTCHIPKYAKKVPTKMTWDWSTAGDDKKHADPHHYLKKKGSFSYEMNLTPEYFWFDKSVRRYLLGDKIDPSKITELNPLNGNKNDPKSKIWPFKVHRGKQIYDKKYLYFMSPVTAGKDGYWHNFDWNQALELSEKFTGLKYSGKYGFAETRMYWPLSHMVAPKQKSLSCNDCHSITQKRFNWKELGYENDPATEIKNK